MWSTTAATANTWMMFFDALTGNYICSIANVSSSGTAFTDKIGTICRISLTTAGGKELVRIWKHDRGYLVDTRIWREAGENMIKNGSICLGDF